MMNKISEDKILYYRKKISDLSNHARYKEVQSMSKKLYKKYPYVLHFQYLEAVFTAEETEGISEQELKFRYQKASEKLKKVLLKLKNQDLVFRLKVRNEYYWFSKQPLKQYKLGIEGVKKGVKMSYYSQGVGAAMLAEKYALEGKSKLMLRWAKLSEKAWLNYFKIVPDWYNSYTFYAMVLGFQGKISEMDSALEKCRIIAKRPKNWSAIKFHRNNIMSVVKKIELPRNK